MPIDYRNYHPMFKRISRFVRLIRAQNRCEGCGLGNYTVLHYYQDRVIDKSEPFTSYKHAKAHLVDWWAGAHLGGNEDHHRFSIVVLTTAHLDHDVTNNDLENLKALCQRCHLGHDRADNADRRRYGPTGQHHQQVRLFN